MTERELAKLLDSNPDLAVEGDNSPRPPLPVAAAMVSLGLGTSITLAYPPSANRYWRTTKQGRMHRSTEATQYKKSVKAVCEKLGIEPTSSNIKVEITLYRPARRGDLDNRIKIVLDSLQEHAYIDDKQVVEIHAKLRDDKHNPRVEVVVTRVNEQ